MPPEHRAGAPVCTAPPSRPSPHVDRDPLAVPADIAGDSVTIWEEDYENPPDDPYHCPATHTEVRVRRGGRVTCTALYYPVASPTGPPEGR